MDTLRSAAALCFFLFVGAMLLLFPAESLSAARDGLSLCFQSVLPSLFPFFVLSSLFVQSSAPELLSRALAGFMFPLFGVGGAGASALILGLLGGYPAGAQTIASLYAHGSVTKQEAEQLLAFCNNSGPGFFLGVCGASVFASTRAGLYLYLVHVLSALLVGLLLRRRHLSPSRCASRERTPSAGFLETFPLAVQSSFAAVWNVCGFVILFMVFLRLLSQFSIFQALSPLARAALFGWIEMTNGVTALPRTREGFVLCAAIMNWGGLSVLAQTRAVLSGKSLSMRRCVLGKALQSALGIPLALLAAPHIF